MVRRGGPSLSLCWSLLDDAGKYVKIFSDIGRESQLQNYYIGCHKVGVVIQSGCGYMCWYCRVLLLSYGDLSPPPPPPPLTQHPSASSPHSMMNS